MGFFLTDLHATCCADHDFETMNATLSLFEEDKFDCLANRFLERIKIKRFNCLWEIFKLVDNYAMY